MLYMKQKDELFETNGCIRFGLHRLRFLFVCDSTYYNIDIFDAFIFVFIFGFGSRVCHFDNQKIVFLIIILLFYFVPKISIRIGLYNVHLNVANNLSFRMKSSSSDGKKLSRFCQTFVGSIVKLSCNWNYFLFFNLLAPDAYLFEYYHKIYFNRFWISFFSFWI